MTTLNPNDFYKYQEEHNYFMAGRNDDERKKTPFTIVIPPPNITGKLHLGHAFTMTMQDIIIRFKRMCGFDCLLLPGTDHAAIATQMIVEKQLAERGIYRREIGRVAFLDEIWKWKATCSGNITSQLRLLGYSADWSRERFTMDTGMSDAVKYAFIRLYNDGLIYKDKRLVNWDPVMQTTVSDLEVNNIETQGQMWYIRYPVENTDIMLPIATTRPETMLGDTAVAVNPADERYNSLIGKNVILPFTGRRIPVVGDEYADMEKGTGVVKITPAHDFNDFEVGKRHNLPTINILSADGKIDLSELTPSERESDFVQSLAGLDKITARKLIVQQLKSDGLFDRTENIMHQVPHNDRGGAVIEPRLTEQWFLNVSDMAKKSIELVKTGKLNFVPKMWENTFFSWLENIQPWCISRQIWWGHQIPAYYTPDHKIIVAKSLAEAQQIAGDGVPLTQDEDTLDTWFSSGLWPMSTLGWPNATPDFERYFPTSTLITGFDIIFFWVARMVMFSVYFTGKSPFSTVVCHGLVRDEHGQKMSKTKGNVIDPIDLINEYGIDAVRWTICTLSGQGRDMNFGRKSVETGRKFITKLENAISFWIQNGITEADNFSATNSIPYTDWIIAQMNEAITNATSALENYRFDEYSAIIYHFVWDCFCDNFIELSKPHLQSGENKAIILATARLVLSNILRMLQPVIPFASAELWEKLGLGKALDFIHETYAKPTEISMKSVGDIDWLINVISAIRSIRAEHNIKHSVPLQITFKSIPESRKSYIPSILAHTRTEYIDTPDTSAQKNMLTSVIDTETTLLISIHDENATADAKAKAREELTAIETRIQSLTKQIETMTGKAPQKVIDDRKESLNSCLEKQKKLRELIGE